MLYEVITVAVLLATLLSFAVARTITRPLVAVTDVMIAVQLIAGQRTPGPLQYAHGDRNNFV